MPGDHVPIILTLYQITSLMDEELDLGTRILNGFLKVMVVVLIGILIAVVISLILALFGIL